MSWNSLANNQCISFNNLQDACNQLLFFSTQAIPVSEQQITKQNFQDYILVPDSVSNYPAFANKAQNQLVVKSDIEVYGNVTLVPRYGIYFTAVDYYDFSTQIPIGGFTYPVTSTTTTSYYSTFGLIGSPYLYVSVDGTSTSPQGFVSVQVSVNGNIVASNSFYYTSGAQSTVVSFPDLVYAPNEVEISIIDGQAIPVNVSFQDQNGGIPIASVLASRGSGQYQMVATGSNGQVVNFLKGSLYRSIDYGATFQKASGDTEYYWDRIAMSDTGQYMLASSVNGPLFLSSNTGASYTDITTRIRGNATEYFEGVGMSGNGQYIIVCYEQGGGAVGFTTKISNNYGAAGSWSTISGISYALNVRDGVSIQGIAISNDGQYMYLSYTSNGLVGVVIRSSNYGASWQEISVGTQYVRDVSCSSDGSTVVVTGAVQNYGAAYLTRGFMFTSTNYGASYTGIQVGDYLQNWYRVGQLYTSTSPSGYGTVMNYLPADTGQVTWPVETYPVSGNTLGSVVNGSVSGMGQRKFTDYAVGGTNGVYRLIGSTTGLFRSTNGGGSWTQL